MSGTDFSDDYVAEMLAKDAKDSSLKYSALGVSAFLPTSKAPANKPKPKPNTRFLRNIIKETDSHNAALLVKEAAESKARLASLETKEVRSVADIRRRQLGQITGILTGRSSTKRKHEVTETESERRKRRNVPSDEDRERSKPGREKSEKSEKRSHEKSSRHRDTGGLDEHRHRSSHRRSRSPMDDKRSSHRRRSRHRSPSDQPERSSRRDRGRDSGRKSYRRKSISPESSRREESEPKSSKHNSTRREIDDDSDPLDDIIGPRPSMASKITSRGRGTISSASGIDSRFSSNYDPKADVQLNFDEENDWDQALEALRDRQKWKQQGADRLRAAGFTADEISKWEKGGEKKEEDVKWAKQGEGREWDKGKTVDATTGCVIIPDIIVRKRSPDIDMSWGRLKDT